MLRWCSALLEVDVKRYKASNTARQIEEEWEQSVTKQHESNAVWEPNSAGSLSGMETRRAVTLVHAERGISVNIPETKSYSQLLGILVAPQYFWFHIWSLCRPAEHHSWRSHVFMWHVEEWALFKKSKCTLSLFCIANNVWLTNTALVTHGRTVNAQF